ncbi:hypothetical protein [Arthrobacter roseus]|uniref:hypothetical protein n=1 Tax=Arthrobacter roseus TaxID=136274 RepID=UPI001964A7A9|nr:hypothetical protein [Arthrobacter roseus]MBM7846834.1 hypothetical protein [Arthrobacter roseus]
MDKTTQNKPRFLRIGRTNWIAGGVAGMVLLGSGIALGTTLPDPTASEQYSALSADMADLEAERADLESEKAAVESDYTELEGEHDTLTSELDDRTAALDQRDGALKDAEEKAKLAAADVKKREEAVTGAEKKKAENTVSEGQWTVGTDIEPGAYRTTSDVNSTCYWGIYTSGSNGDDIIANDLPGGGRPTVTLAVGQDFSTLRCGTWQKQ